MAPLPHQPVGVFDSGVGGLTVLHELLVSLPAEDYLYLGDTARFPYGDRNQRELEAFSVEIADHLLGAGAKLLVIACNSASAAALDAVERHVRASGRDVDVIGVLRPAAQVAVVASHTGRIGLLATPATVASGAYERAVEAADPHVHLESVACPDLAPIIQGGFPFDEAVVATVRGYCVPLRDAQVDTVILGSTHYPLCAAILQRMLGRGVTLVSAGMGVARERRARARLARAAQPAGRRGQLSVRMHRRRRVVPHAGHALPADAARRGGSRRPAGSAGGVTSAGAPERSYGRARGRTSADGDRARVRPHRDRFGADLDGGDARDLHRLGPGERAALASGSGRGWVTAEYGMLPASTGDRKQRDISRGKLDGRSVEIQRLIGRSLRGVVDFAAARRADRVHRLRRPPGRRRHSLRVDHRWAGRAAARVPRLVAEGALDRLPLTGTVAAVSCGIVDGVPLLDLDYREDSSAEVDANVVMTGDGDLVEVQATAERTPLSRAHLDELLALAAKGIVELRAVQDAAVAAAAG